jgi:DNA-directed RNA polymerase subunit RPC12/RpoP
VAILARCGSCGKQFQAQPHLAGKTVPCPFCGGQLTVPTAAAAGGAANAQPAPPAKPGAATKPRTPASRTAAARPAPAPTTSRAGTPQIVSCRCGARFKADAHLAGKTVACPTCKQPLKVPLPGPVAKAAAAPARPADDFWDALLPQEPKKPAVPEPDPHAEESVTGHQATALAISLLSRGLSPQQVRQQLVERGVSQIETERVVDTLAPESRSKSSPQTDGRNSGVTNMLVGGVVCFIGVAVTVGSYVAAEPGGYFLLAYGPIIFGGIQFIRGLVQLVSRSA